MASPLGLGAALRAALVAALLAALLATAWHEIASEPLVEQAIQLEAARHAGAPEEAPLVSREAQRLGLAVALGLYGLTWALAIGGVFALAQERLPGGSAGRRAALLALGVAGRWRSCRS